jgi:integrase/recombinase XerD
MSEKFLNQVRLLMEKFLQDRQMQGYSQDGKATDRYGLYYFLEFLKIQDIDHLPDVTSDVLHKYQMHMYRMNGKSGKPLGLVTQCHLLVTVRGFFQWLVRRGDVLSDPAAGLTLPKLKKPLPRGVLTKKEVEKILSVPDIDTPLGLRDRAILEMLYSTGLRNKELRELTIYDVNTKENEVHVREGKGGKGRVVPLGEITGKYVDLYLKESRPKILAKRPDPGILFLGRLGNKIWRCSLSENIVRKYGKLAKINKPVTPHGFRHTCATHLLKGHADIRYIQELLGHKSLESTQIYTRVEVGDLKQELKRCHPREQIR